MKYFWKVYKGVPNFDDDVVDFTDKVIIPIFLEPTLDETLEAGQVTLDTLDIAKPFAPKTKFRIERYSTKDYSDNPKAYDLIVASDQVEKYPTTPAKYCHRVHLISPAAALQGVHIDNISLTYETRDQTLNYKTLLSPDAAIDIISQGQNAISNSRRPSGGSIEQQTNSFGDKFWAANTYDFYENIVSRQQSFANHFSYKWDNSSLNNIRKYGNIFMANTIKFDIPKCYCYFMEVANYETLLFEMPTRTTVKRRTLLNGVYVDGSEETVTTLDFNPTGIQSRNDEVMYNKDGLVGFRKYINITRDRTGLITSLFSDGDSPGNSWLTTYPAIINTVDTSHTNRELTFITDTLPRIETDKGYSYEYNIYTGINSYQQGSVRRSYTAYEYVGNFTSNGPFYNRTQTLTDFGGSDIQDALFTQFQIKCIAEYKSTWLDFLVKPAKYSAFNLLRKALLTVDSHLIDNTIFGLDEQYDADGKDISIASQYMLGVHPEWVLPLKQTNIYETIFEQKNLWEVLTQLGYYLHAIPKIIFNDGTYPFDNEYILTFTKLGEPIVSTKTSDKLTVFSSSNINDFFTQFDSYVSVFYSPLNEIDEYLTVKTSDSSFLISNDTAELRTKYNILEIVEFDIAYNEVTQLAKQYIFEKTVYDILPTRENVLPGKHSAVYYNMGSNKILGFQYAAVRDDGSTMPSALKSICQKLGFGDNIKFLDLVFHVKYKLQDSLRITTVRPEISDFMRIGRKDKYPHHEQYFSQQDKIVDSERFTENLFGKLLKIANDIVQIQEYIPDGNEREVGELVEIDGSPYYVSKCENEYHDESILQKVTYSKNFNQLSQIVTIPSEPRFYEISERSMIRREVRILEFFNIANDITKFNNKPPEYLRDWQELLANLLFGGTVYSHIVGNDVVPANDPHKKKLPQLPNFAYTNFAADDYRTHLKYDGVSIVDKDKLFPSNETKIIDEDGQQVTYPKESTDNRGVITPLSIYPLKNSIVFEWDMDDNFKAGDATIPAYNADSVDDSSYVTMQPVRYCDAMGKADLLKFILFRKTDWSKSQLLRLPYADANDFIPEMSGSFAAVPEPYSLGLDKDNREALSFNYQVIMTGGNDFILFRNLFEAKNRRLRLAILDQEINQFSDSSHIDFANVLVDNVPFSIIGYKTSAGAQEILAIVIDSSDIEVDTIKIKALCFYDADVAGFRYPTIVKRVDGTTYDDLIYIHPLFNTFT
jgi:hypothetical protein